MPADLLLPQPQRLRLLKGAGPRGRGLRLAGLPARLRALARALLPEDPDGAELLIEGSPRWRIPQLGDDESYRLQLSSSRVRLSATTLAGARHGLHSLSQLWQAGPPPSLSLSDAPRHPWRGLLVDVARRPLPLTALLRLLDQMAAAKLNVLHWHLSDDQAWRLGSLRYPRLQQLASNGFHYSLAQAAQLVAAAAERGIRVLPELDLPGHCWALGLAYPELLCAPAPTQAQTGFGVFPCAVDPTKEALYEFLDGLIEEWAAVFPDHYLHLGGDELAPQPWQQLAHEQGCTIADLQSRYSRRVGEVLARHRRRLVAWDEMGDAPLPAGSLLQAWRGSEALSLAPAGLAGRLRSAGYYLDQAHPAAWHWRRPLQAPRRPAAPPAQAERWALQAQAGNWRVEGSLWRHEDRAWLQLHSSGTLMEWLQPVPVADPLAAWRLRVDSDLGELEFWGPETDGTGAGWLRLGNLRLHCAWWALPEGVDWPPRHRRATAAPLLGGEAALWGELVEAPQLALRGAGPGLLAIAERLWSDPPAGSALEASLASRIAATQRWLLERGLRDADPAAAIWAALCPEPDAQASLRALAAWLEPGAGYARQHHKKQQGRYEQGEALDRLVDALPTESPLIAQLGKDAAAWRAALRDAERQLPRWQALLAAPELRDALPLIPRLQALFELGLQLWREGRLSAAAALRAQRQLHAAAGLVDEMVPALVQALQRRLDQRRGIAS